jgi:PIN domain nuclease of toxin-antitoxin system
VVDSAVADTHALMMHIAARPALGARAGTYFRAADSGNALVFIPVAVVWEVAFLSRAGRVDLRRTPSVFFNELFLNPSYQPLDLTLEQVFAADAARFNRDPFDALIVAAAQVLGLPLITRDADIIASKAVKVLW